MAVTHGFKHALQRAMRGCRHNFKPWYTKVTHGSHLTHQSDGCSQRVGHLQPLQMSNTFMMPDTKFNPPPLIAAGIEVIADKELLLQKFKAII